MSPKRLLITILCLFCLQKATFAQGKGKIQFPKITSADFHLPASPIIDSNTSAVILMNAGSTYFVGNEKGWLSYVFVKKERIKIINKQAFGLATVQIPLYARDEDAEKVVDLDARTYNLENGNVVETPLDKNEVFDSKLDKYHSEKKFALPAVREGSIIEYSYKIASDFNFNLPSWEFQSEDYPCLWSEYDVTIPQLLFYALIKQGIHPYFIDKASEGYESYNVSEKDGVGGIVSTERDLNVGARTAKHHWAMKDIPAFHVENYISTPRNYIDKIEFQLSKTYNGEDTRDVINTWTKANEELLKKENFGAPLGEENYWLNALLDEITKNIPGKLDRAKAIYYYMTSHFTCTNDNVPYITTRMQDIVQKHSGSVGDLNLLMIAMLRKADIPADPVMLSTREFGFNLPKYPVMERLNYVIVRVAIDGHTYYLDAAHRHLGFGQLDEDCYNGHARIISEKDSASVYFYADSLKEKKTTLILIVNNEKGGIEGSYQSTTEYPGSYELRSEVNRKGEKDFFKDIQTSYGEDLQISNTGIDSLDQPEMPVKVYYDFRLNQAPGADHYYFTPLFADAFRTNPFKAVERKYPVEMPHAIDHNYILNMEIPSGYAIDELPKSARVALNGGEGLFEYLVSADTSTIQMSVRVKLNQAEFYPEDYSALRDFFGYIVKKEAEQIVLKKKE